MADQALAAAAARGQRKLLSADSFSDVNANRAVHYPSSRSRGPTPHSYPPAAPGQLLYSPDGQPLFQRSQQPQPPQERHPNGLPLHLYPQQQQPQQLLAADQHQRWLAAQQQQQQQPNTYSSPHAAGMPAVTPFNIPQQQLPPSPPPVRYPHVANPFADPDGVTYPVHPHFPIELLNQVVIHQLRRAAEDVRGLKRTNDDKLAYVKAYASPQYRDDTWVAEMVRFSGIAQSTKSIMESRLRTRVMFVESRRQYSMPPQFYNSCLKDHNGAFQCNFPPFPQDHTVSGLFQGARWLLANLRRKPHIIITGSHRSGTTVLRDFLGLNERLHVVEEPLHRRHPCADASYLVHPNIGNGYGNGRTAGTEPNSLACVWYARLNDDMPPMAKTIAESFFGDMLSQRRSAPSNNDDHQQFFASRVLFKDPFLSTSLDWITKFLEPAGGSKVILTIKNPLFFADSLIKGGYNWVVFPFDDLARQSALMSALPTNLATQVRNLANWQSRQYINRKFSNKIAEHTASVRMAALNAPLLWNVVYFFVAEYMKRHPQPETLFVRNEDLITDPQTTMQKVMQFIDEPYLPHYQSYVQQWVRPTQDYAYVSRLPLQLVEDVLVQTWDTSKLFYTPEQWYELLHPDHVDYFVGKGILPSPSEEYLSASKNRTRRPKVLPRVPPVRHTGITMDVIDSINAQLHADQEVFRQIREGLTSVPL